MRSTGVYVASFLGGIAIISWLAAGLAHAQQAPGNIPGTLTPGGQRPQLEDRPKPARDPAVLKIPPAAGRPLAPHEGPLVVVQLFDLDVDDALSGRLPSDVQATVEDLFARRIASQPENGLSIAQLEFLAQQVTDAIRASGFVLAWAYVPVQEVEGGRVRIEVLAGWLEEVNFEGNRRYRTARLDRPFDKLKGEAVQLKELESAVLTVRDYPGLSPSAILSPGQSVGSSDLTIQVAESMLSGSVAGDNYGSEASGEYRFVGSLGWNSPLHNGDLLRVDVLQTFDPSDNTYGSVFYDTPIFGSGWSTSLSYSTNAFDIKSLGTSELPADIKLSGDSQIAAWQIAKQFIRGRNFNVKGLGALSLKRATFDDPNVGERQDKLTVVSLGVGMDGVDKVLFTQGINQLNLFVHVGIDDFLGSMDSNGDFNSTRQGGVDRRFAGGDFNKIVIDYQRLQRITKLNSLLLRGFYQWSDDLLVSLEQVALGGAFNSRAYRVSAALVDKGGFATAEWIFSIGDWERFNGAFDLSFSLFFDYGGGRNNDPLPGEEERIDLSNWGGAIDFGIDVGSWGRLIARLDLARPLSESRGSDNPLDPEFEDEDLRAWGRLALTF